MADGLSYGLAGILVVIAAVLAAMAFAERARCRAMLTWPVVKGTVAVTGLDAERRVHRHAARLMHMPTIAYRYSAGGADHIGSRISNQNILFEREDEAVQFLSRFPSGTVVDVHYNPVAPNEALLQPRVPDPRPRLIGAGIALVAAVLLIVL
ncbi:DUF3592 domain-containing protein [Zavarzinia sp.]|uniref:DUF3592 domain-containing protein n=1 Tax=Zavarzinia sp. TaxID=2027920 RepID=UPI003BB75F45